MEIIEAILLGIVQGLSEFLPISSSGHLLLGQHLLNQDTEGSVLFIITVHAATALSTIVVYRKDLAKIFMDLITFKWNDSYNFSLFILISMIPAAAVGFTMEDMIDDFMTNPANSFAQLMLVGCSLFFTAFVLYIAEVVRVKKGIINYWKSFVIGVSQAVAIIPGVSRSGSTIATSLLLGVNKKKAARFSFLMALPVILGAMAKKILDLNSGSTSISSTEGIGLVFGFIAAFVSGYFACTWMIRLVRKSKLRYFSYYCIVAGIGAIILAFVKYG
ncbi:MAG: undecaprenyl-diphosphate phosphatase [Crocinitomicaceae bacterium]|nr:undecaprenyl-diphosphate phosphatase [Crocinitomicaceae bacterium]